LEVERTVSARRAVLSSALASRAGRLTTVALLSVGALSLGSGTASADTTINCDTAAQPSSDWTTCQQLTGTAKCVWNNGDGTWTMALGYINNTGATLTAAIPSGSVAGTNNNLTATNGSAANPAHISTFAPGTSTTAFTVTWSPSSKKDPVNWSLMGQTFSFNDQITSCTSKPVPVVANETFGGIAVAAVLGTVLVSRRKLRPLAIKRSATVA
jgi:hypothetical protein